MKITKQELKQLIREELQKALAEQSTDEGCFDDQDCPDGYRCKKTGKNAGLCCNPKETKCVHDIAGG